MRKVTVCNKGFFGGVDKNEASDFREGLFHGFFSEGSNDEGIECYALVEFFDGEVKMYQTHKIKFNDNPPKSEKIESPDSAEESRPKGDTNSAMAKHDFITGYIPAMGDVEACPTCGVVRAVLRQ